VFYVFSLPELAIRIALAAAMLFSLVLAFHGGTIVVQYTILLASIADVVPLWPAG